MQVTDLDLGRKEGLVTIIPADGKPIAERARVLDVKAVIALTYPGMTEKPVQGVSATVSSFSTSPDTPNDNVILFISDTSDNAKLLAIQTTQFMGGITDLCGMKDFVPRRTMSAKSFMAQLEKSRKKAEAEAKKEHKKFVCNVAVPKDSDGTGEIKEVSFVNEKVKFLFTENELTSVIFY